MKDTLSVCHHCYRHVSAIKFEQDNKNRQERSKLKEEERISKFKEFKLNKPKESTPKEDLITKLESFEIDNNKKN